METERNCRDDSSSEGSEIANSDNEQLITDFFAQPAYVPTVVEDMNLSNTRFELPVDSILIESSEEGNDVKPHVVNRFVPLNISEDIIVISDED